MPSRPLTNVEQSALFNLLVDLEDHAGSENRSDRNRLIRMSIHDILDEKDRIDLFVRDLTTLATRAKALATLPKGKIRLGGISPRTYTKMAEICEAAM